MAFPQPNAQRELANRKILEELQLKKQMLLKAGAAPPLAPPPSPLPMCSIPPVSALTGFGALAEGVGAHTSQRAALLSAQAASCAFFVSQDSCFGNHILPVLPRFDNK